MGGADLARPTYAVRTVTPPVTLTDLARATSVGLPLPRELERGPLHVMRATHRPRIRRAGCEPHKGLESRDVVRVQGLSVTAPAETWCDLAETLALDDLIVLGDAVARRAGDVRPLAEAVARRSRPRGAGRMRHALGLVRSGSDSAMETRSRLIFVRAGLPEPELNAAIRDENGEWLATSDFVWRAHRVIGEYQGEVHFGDFERGDSDICRRLLIEDHDWKYLEITRHDVFRAGRRHLMLARLVHLLGVDPLGPLSGR